MKAIALVIGVALLAVGAAGFIPALYTDGLLFGVMPMDQLRSVLFALTGVAGIAIGLSNRRDLVPPHNPDAHDLRTWM